MKNIFSKMLFSLAEQDPGIIVLTNDVMFPDWEVFRDKFPKRFYNFGLTEQTTVGISAGLASQGFKPIVYTIAPFLLERAFEFIKLDVDENKLPVILVGYDYESHYGPSHTCLNAKDMVYLFKNTRGYFPETEAGAEYAMRSAYRRQLPSYIHLKKSK